MISRNFPSRLEIYMVPGNLPSQLEILHSSWQLVKPALDLVQGLCLFNNHQIPA